jgi:Na+/serine symporter
MDELSVISLEQAKNHLVVLNDSFYDAQITGIIKTAIGMVEQYTDYRLYQRDVVISMVNCRQDISLFPITISRIDNDGNAQAYKAYQRTLSIVIDCPTWYNSVINASVGYEDVTQIPYPLIGACYKIITYLFENKDAYESTLPYDVQLMLNQWRRSASI